MKKLLIVLALSVTSFAQAAHVGHFTFYRDGGGQIEAVISNSDEGLRIAIKNVSTGRWPMELNLRFVD